MLDPGCVQNPGARAVSIEGHPDAETEEEIPSCLFQGPPGAGVPWNRRMEKGKAIPH